MCPRVVFSAPGDLQIRDLLVDKLFVGPHVSSLYRYVYEMPSVSQTPGLVGVYTGALQTNGVQLRDNFEIDSKHLVETIFF